MNSLFTSLGIESWKPVLSSLLLPPVPFLLLTLIGARLLLPRRGLGWLLILTSVSLLWLSACSGAVRGMTQFWMQPPPALSFDQVRELKADVASKKAVAIVILGAGFEPFAPEYGVSSLTDTSLERLRYGLWLGRETGAPIAFSGGNGYAQDGAGSEARVAAKIANEEFNRPIKWLDAESHDTRDNATRTIALLKPSGIDHIVLVTHGYHMARALRDFREAAGPGIQVDAAPMGLARKADAGALDWMPSSRGFRQMRELLHEVAGRASGA
ncbi:MAG: YdcF family protein [Pseudomonadota bacterium]|nr:YdcF family protein [Pseudomonadota bacterium]